MTQLNNKSKASHTNHYNQPNHSNQSNKNPFSPQSHHRPINYKVFFQSRILKSLKVNLLAVIKYKTSKIMESISKEVMRKWWLLMIFFNWMICWCCNNMIKRMLLKLRIIIIMQVRMPKSHLPQDFHH